jgi:hypothetical protein
MGERFNLFTLHDPDRLGPEHAREPSDVLAGVKGELPQNQPVGQAQGALHMLEMKSLAREVIAGALHEWGQSKILGQPYMIPEWGKGREAPGVDAGLAQDLDGNPNGQAGLPQLQHPPDELAPSKPCPEPPCVRAPHHAGGILRR